MPQFDIRLLARDGRVLQVIPTDAPSESAALQRALAKKEEADDVRPPVMLRWVRKS